MAMEFDSDGIFEIRKIGREIRLTFVSEDKAMSSYWKFHRKMGDITVF